MNQSTSSVGSYNRLKLLVRHNINSALPIALILFGVFLVSTVLNFYSANRYAQQQGKLAIAELENFITNTASDLLQLSEQVSDRCDRTDVLALRKYVFYSPILKETGIYKDGRVFCTSNEGVSDIPLFSSILQRISESPNHITISLTRSKSRLQTFFVFASNDKKSGVNALLPPEQFLRIVAPTFEKYEYGYQISVLNQTIQSEHGSIESAHKLFSFSSHLYPLSVTLHLNADSYQYHYQQQLWKTLLMAALLSVGYLFFSNYLISRNSIEHSLKSALHHKEFELYLQPIVDIHKQRIAGSEALIRWVHPEQGNIPPDIFIPLAERIGVIDEVTKKMLKAVTAFLYQNRKSLDGQYISLNISRQLVINDQFMHYIQRYAKRHPTITPLLLLEITENNDYSSSEMDKAIEAMKTLNQLGFRIAVDDFGTGYSGLNFIRQHNFDVLKIDKVFIKSLHSDSSITPVLMSMIGLGEELNMKVIAEGVETQAQIDQLRKLGVRYIQGFYYSAPLPPREFINFGQHTMQRLFPY
ncbi:EAL domain-containing protein [Vibrio paucivorans]|uniref:cyclic-guanylate-specific phosphodiesterase n=1 Tax=Vibrio paucivorans TaxID=2829489 RepID=A0A9X3HNY7_9VIBR|nr:EAL domain-containing protein [Vibrio paucivorans]MCW8332364.1 EAL domain-containing protein [Vibrio paucivorans]